MMHQPFVTELPQYLFISKSHDINFRSQLTPSPKSFPKAHSRGDPPVMNDWTTIPPPRRESFTIDDIRHCTDPHLAVVMRTGITALFLEFHQLPGEHRSRAHFFFRLNEAVYFRDHDGHRGNIKGCAIWMGPSGYGLHGVVKLRFLIGKRPFVAPLASFRFPLHHAELDYTEHDTMIDVVNLLQGSAAGLPELHRSDLTRFRFAMGREGWEGSRDVLIQWMIRLSLMGIVDWKYTDQMIEDAEYIGIDATNDGNTFDQIIGQSLSSDEFLDEEGYFTVEIVPRRVRRGEFLSSRVMRVTSHKGAFLPYRVQ
ncbi:hypothetical protein ACJ41O_006838 [Fusarium nematophilum]